MKSWLRTLIALVEALVVAAAVYFEPAYGVRGRIWGEAFFEGKSTSYWNHELEHWQVHYVDLALLTQPPVQSTMRMFQREQSSLERWRVRFFPIRDANDATFSGPSILNGGDAARPVLEALQKIGSPKVCALANIGLGIDPNLRPVDPEVFWTITR